MKKILLFILLSFALSACGEQRTTTEIEMDSVSIKEMTYNGHDYILFFEAHGYAGGLSAVHSPECRCNELNHF